MRESSRRAKKQRFSSTAAPNPDPVVVFVMRLFTAAAMADDGVLETDRAAAREEVRTRLGPIGFEVVLRGRKWDKENRGNGALP